MGFRLVPKSVTLNDLEQRHGRVVCVISPNLVAFVASYVKAIDRFSREKCQSSPTKLDRDAVLFAVMELLVSKTLYTLRLNKVDHQSMVVTLTNFNRFSKFFHH